MVADGDGGRVHDTTLGADAGGDLQRAVIAGSAGVQADGLAWGRADAVGVTGDHAVGAASPVKCSQAMSASPDTARAAPR